MQRHLAVGEQLRAPKRQTGASPCPVQRWKSVIENEMKSNAFFFIEAEKKHDLHLLYSNN